MTEKIDDDGLLDLCTAIVLQACKEYKTAYKHNDKGALFELNRFFHSEHFVEITRGKLDAEYIIEGLQKQVEEEEAARAFHHRRITPHKKY